MSLLSLKEKYFKYLDEEKEKLKNELINNSNWLNFSKSNIKSIVDNKFEELKKYCDQLVHNEIDSIVDAETEGLNIKVSSSAILLKDEIKNAIEDGYIVIDPFDESKLKLNYYELRLDKRIKSFIPFDVVKTNKGYYSLRKKPLKNMIVLDVKSTNPLYEIEIPDEGIILPQNVVFMMNSLEFIKTNYYVPAFEEDNLLASLGAQIQTTSTISSIGFAGHALFRMVSVHPIIIYPNMTIGKVFFYNSGKKVIDF